MHPGRTFLSCHKCGKNCVGKFKDASNNPLCMTCNPTGKVKMISCIICGNGHHNIMGDNKCNDCRKKEARKSENPMRSCPTCGGRMHTQLPNMTNALSVQVK